MEKVNEGEARIYINGDVFYNPRMQNLRDISVSFLNAVGCEGKSLLDATSASGIRAIRYAKECGIRDGIALDINKKAYDVCKRNIRSSGINFGVNNTSLQRFANEYTGKFGVIDLDPFGSPAPYIYDIMKLSEGGTVLMITSTDTAVLCGAHSKACVKQYNARPLHNELCKEVGIRIMTGHISRVASQFNFGITPLLSISDMHYMRVFVVLGSGAAEAGRSLARTGLGGHCGKCGSTFLGEGMAPLIGSHCGNCGSGLEGFGPLWTGKLYDKTITSRMLGNKDIKIIRVIDEELDVPMFYSIPKVTKRVGRNSVSHYRVIELLSEEGWTATATQFDRNGVKTDAGQADVLDIVKRIPRA